MRQSCLLRLLGGALLAAGSSAAIAQAQTIAINPEGEATFGASQLEAGFVPDPVVIPLTAGGPINAADIDPECSGWVAATPDHKLFYTAGSQELFISAVAEADTTLLINLPDRAWICNDDGAEGLNPGLRFDEPGSGRYDIWVGTFEDQTAPAALHISELEFGMAGGVDISGEATYGEVRLSAGFEPDPHLVSVVAGGGREAASVSPGCPGSVASVPDVKLFYEASEGYELFISARSVTDTTLLVNTPNGDWVCDDDSGGDQNPVLTFAAPSSGRYDIFIGTYGADASPATLAISERQPF